MQSSHEHCIPLKSFIKSLYISRFMMLAIIFQVLLILFFWRFTTYALVLDPTSQQEGGVGLYYPFYQDVHVMMFIGFGFLLAYLGRYSLTSIAMNFLLGVLCIQWSLLTNGFWSQVGYWNQVSRNFTGWEPIPLNIQSLISADFAVAAVLISFGGVLGKFSAPQYLIMAFFEVFFYSINLWLGQSVYGAIDMGGSMYIHAFGAYFGLAVAWLFTTEESKIRLNNHSTYTSDTYSMIGTIFLWMFWPSFNGALAVAGQQHRVIVNTVLSLCVSATVAFFLSSVFHKGKFEMAEIQNATLAGGVAVGCSSDLVIQPWGAMTIGFVAGTISTLGFRFLTPFLERRINLHDTAGIHNLHGMPGILGGLGGIFSSLVAGESVYGTSIGFLFPRRAPSNPAAAAALGVAPGDDRTAQTQAGYQCLATVTSVLLGLATGLFTGWILRLLARFSDVKLNNPKDYFLDTPFIHVPSDYPGSADSVTVRRKNEESSEESEVGQYMHNVTVNIPEQIRKNSESSGSVSSSLKEKK